VKGHLDNSKTVTRSVVLIATPTARVRSQWTQALKDMCTVLAVGERGSLDRSLADLKPDILLLDLALHRLGGIEGVLAIRKLSPETKIVLFTKSPTAKEGISLLRARAWGYCEKAIEPLCLKKVVLTLQKGEVWVKRNLVPHLIGELARLTRRGRKDSPTNLDTRLASLTPREREVVFLVGDGASNKEIASQLAVTEHTVKAHLTAIFRKLELSGRVQLALLANQSGRGATSPPGSDDRSAGEPLGSTRPKSN
jgi:DNA-binding NarL/FixJ family response regulator